MCLPAGRKDFSGEVCRITGWGKDGWGSEGEFQSILKETEVPVINSNVCQQILRGTKLGSSYSLPGGMMCAGGEENKDACKVSFDTNNEDSKYIYLVLTRIIYRLTMAVLIQNDPIHLRLYFS